MGKILLLINNRYFSKMVLENSGNKSSALGLQYEPENLDRVFQIAVRGCMSPPVGENRKFYQGGGGFFYQVKGT